MPANPREEWRSAASVSTTGSIAIAQDGRPTRPSRFRRWTWRHPEWWVVVAAIAAWAGIALMLLSAETTRGVHGGHVVGRDDGLRWRIEDARVILMTFAMMGPLTLPTLRHLSFTSLWHRRHRSQALFLSGYLLTWVATGAGIAAAVEAIKVPLGGTVLVGGLSGSAALWQFAQRKRRAIRRCGRTVPVAAGGWRADRDCFRFGVESGANCVVSCCGLMAVVAAAGHSVGVMAVLFLVQLHERIARRYIPMAGAVVVGAVGVWSLASSTISP